MSDVKKNQCDIQEKSWNDYSSEEIRRYCLRNSKRCDCSFKSGDQEEKKVYKSFKWILWDMSPVLKEMLNDEKNQAKNCKEIVVSNSKHIEAILFYAHMKIVETKIIDLIDFYGASKQYQVKILEEKVIEMFNSEEIYEKHDWVKLFWLSYVKYSEDQQMRAIFEKVNEHVKCNDKFTDANIDFILDFDGEYFDIFLDIMLSRLSRLKCFAITEAYFIKNFFDGYNNKKLDDIDLIERNFVEWCMIKMDFGNAIYWDGYKNGPLVSNLLTTKLKIENLETMKGRYSSYCNATFDDIQSCLQKLRAGESNIKTEKKL